MSKKKIITLVIILPMLSILLTGCLNNEEKKWVNTYAEILCLESKMPADKIKNKEVFNNYIEQAGVIAKENGFSSFEDYIGKYAQVGSLSESKRKKINKTAFNKAKRLCGYEPPL
jgi:predicted small integral membrane protein